MVRTTGSSVLRQAAPKSSSSTVTFALMGHTFSLTIVPCQSVQSRHEDRRSLLTRRGSQRRSYGPILPRTGRTSVNQTVLELQRQCMCKATSERTEPTLEGTIV